MQNNNQEFHYKKWIMINFNYIPEMAGCYAFYIYSSVRNNYKLLYVGTSTNLKRRITAHNIYNRLKSKKFLIKIRFINKHRLKLEKYFIKRLHPTLNKRLI